jgi:hypothetical protein
MKKVLTVMLVALMVALLFVSCKKDPVDDSLAIKLTYVLKDVDGNYEGSFKDSSAKTVVEGVENVTLPTASELTAPEGAVFDGWYTEKDSDGNRTYYAGGAEFVVKKNTKLYANWLDSNLAYTVDGDSSVTVKSSANAASYKVSGWYQGKKVTVVGDFTAAKDVITSIKLPDTIKSISERAFKDCAKLASCNFPSGLEKIGQYAFHDCSITTDSATGALVLPDSVKSVDSCAFEGNTAIKSFTLLAASETTIGNQVFYYCSNLKSVTLGPGVTTIDWQAFFKCDALTSVTIQKSAGDIKKMSDFDSRWSSDTNGGRNENIKVYDASGNEVK